MKHDRKICVLGLGYVGLPAALCFSKVTHVIAFDVSKQRVHELKQGIDVNKEYPSTAFAGTDIAYTSDVLDIAAADFYIVAVPTPIDERSQPDMSILRSISAMLSPHLNSGDIVVYESTVYPGATEEYCAPILEEKSGLISGQDFFLGYSPERINPGDDEHTFTTIKKIVAGQTDEVCDVIARVYGNIIDAGIHKAPSIKVAEAAKVIENTQRDVNIALMNECSLIFEKMGIDSLDVLEAAGTKWNFLPFKPGLVGGHCIGIDPYYLTYKASLLGHDSQIILAGRSINEGMGKVVADRVIKALGNNDQQAKDSLITILGLTFKENIADLRNSKVINVASELLSVGATLQIHDPIANRAAVKSLFHDIEMTEFAVLKPAAAIILAVAHQAYRKLGWSDIVQLLSGSGIVFDVKGILPRENIPESILLLRL